MINTTPCQPIGNDDGQSVSTKKCSKCGEVKLRAEYRKNSGNKDGLFGYCRSCSLALEKSKRDPEKERSRRSYGSASTPEFLAPDEFIGPVVYLPCTTCGAIKSIFHFSRHSASKYKRNPCCLECNSAKSRGYFNDNKAQCSASAKVYREAHADEIKASKAAYFQENKEAIVEKKRQWALANPDENHEFWAAFYARHKERLSAEAKVRRQDPRYKAMGLASQRRQRYNNPERFREYQRAYHAENWERKEVTGDAWRAENTVKVQEYQKRRAMYIGNGGFLSWKEFRGMVRKAQHLSEITGYDLELDHIYPIMGATVCGLNTPANLQVVSREYNQNKGNKMPGFLAHEHYATEPWEVYYG